MRGEEFPIAEAGLAPDHAPEVLAALLARIRERGQISFAEFMEVALYEAPAGYYVAGRDRGRDYRTSPAVHPVFAALLTLQLEQMWELLGRPPRFDVVEVGAGGNELADEIMRQAPHLCPDCAQALRYVAVDAFAQASPARSQRIGPEPVHASALALPFAGVKGCIISNELIDAFPVHRVLRGGGRLQEQYVTWRADRFHEVCGELSSLQLEAYFERLGLEPREGVLVEVNLAGRCFMGEVARALEKGFIVTIDYGKAAQELFLAGQPGGTIRCFHEHRCVSNPYRSVGHQDITADVDFSSLILSGREAGLRLTGSTSQREFLLNLGFEAFERELEHSAPDSGARYRNKFAMQELISRSGLGAFRVLIQHKGVHDPELDGLHPFGHIRRDLLSRGRQARLPLI